MTMMIKSSEERNDSKEDIVKSIGPGVRKVCRDHDIIAAYLYGSFVREEQHSGSDIDIAIYFKDYSLKKLLELSRRIQEETGMYRLDIRALNVASPRFQFRVIQNGDILYGSSPEERADIEVNIDWSYHDVKPLLQEHWELRRKKGSIGTDPP